VGSDRFAVPLAAGALIRKDPQNVNGVAFVPDGQRSLASDEAGAGVRIGRCRSSLSNVRGREPARQPSTRVATAPEDGEIGRPAPTAMSSFCLVRRAARRGDGLDGNPDRSNRDFRADGAQQDRGGGIRRGSGLIDRKTQKEGSTRVGRAMRLVSRGPFTTHAHDSTGGGDRAAAARIGKPGSR